MTLPSPACPPLALFSGAAGEIGAILLETQRPGVRDRHSYLLRDPVEILVARRPDEVAHVLSGAGDRQSRGFVVAGYVAYEAGCALDEALASLEDGVPVRSDGFPLAWLCVYPGVLRFDHLGGRWAALGHSVPDWPVPPAAADRPLPAADPETPRFSMSEQEHAQRVGEIRSAIARGDVYQANLTGTFSFRTDAEPFALYERLRAAQPVPYGAFLRTADGCIVSQSPELFFRVRRNRIETRPMKGTAPRGLTAAEDRAAAAALSSDPKNRAENVMIVDLLRNDLGKICETGSVETSRLFEVQRYRTVLQMVSTVTGTVRSATPPAAIFRALFPCGSVTGAPKISAMRLLDRLEPDGRGVYTGAVGILLPGGDMAFSVAIRTVTVRDGRARAGAGGGIVWDSTPREEFLEVRDKGRYLTEEPVAFDLLETFFWSPSTGFRHLGAHMKRLSASARYFGFRFREGAVTAALDKTLRERDGDSARRVRLRLRRDGGVAVEILPLPAMPPPGTPWKIAFARSPVSSRDPFVRHKTTHRATRDAEREAARANGFDEAIFRNERGELTEGAITNLFLEIDGRLLTPPLSCGLLNGVMRDRLLADRSLDVAERTLFPEDLARASRILLTNSVRGVLPAITAPPA